MSSYSLLGISLLAALIVNQGLAEPIQHDAEYYILQAQNAERWRSDDKAVSERLEQIRKAVEGLPGQAGRKEMGWTFRRIKPVSGQSQAARTVSIVALYQNGNG